MFPLRFAAIVVMLLLVASLQAEGTSSDSADLRRMVLEEFTESRLGPRAQLSIHIADVPRGVTELDINADVARRPASLMKLPTVAAAISVLGLDEIFFTTVETTGPMESGILFGDLVVRGGGDPSLGPRFTRQPSNVTAVLDQWAQAIRAKGIRLIEGNILGDDLRYADDRISPHWERRDIAEWFSAEVSALNYNDNVHDILWRAGASTGSRVSFELIPPTSYFELNSGVRVGAPGQIGSQLRYFRAPGSTEVRVRGSLPPRTTKYDFAAMHDPAAWTAHLFMERLRARGVQVKGTALSRRAISNLGAEDDPTSESLVFLRHASPPLEQMLPVVLGESQNLYAEVLLREVALALNEEASFRGGAAALTRWMIQNRIHRTGFLATDGSGLGHHNRMTARNVVDVLRFMARGPAADVWRESLATPGQRSMRSRMNGEQFQPLRGRLQAKTGYVTGTHALAGYLTVGGVDYAFAIMVTDYEPERSLAARDFIDRLTLILSRASALQH
jgi:D-alanyl-D-alanine carboxypeptidase/D-alanyl-D-alanine-endopeptidase (penicillin-binding protein 4)